MYNHGERTKVGIRLSCYTFEFENNMPQPVLDTQKKSTIQRPLRTRKFN